MVAGRLLSGTVGYWIGWAFVDASVEETSPEEPFGLHHTTLRKGAAWEGAAASLELSAAWLVGTRPAQGALR